MLELKEKIAYLHGLAEGLQLDKDTKEGKILLAILDVLDEMAESIEDLAADQEDLEEYVETLGENLGEIGNIVFGDNDYCCHEDYDEDYDEEDYEEDGFIEVQCPKCHDIVRFEASILDDDDVIEVCCPNCDEVVYVNDDTEIADEEEADEEE